MNRIRKIRITLSCIFCIITCNLYAQIPPCPDNIDFEFGSLFKWELDTGKCCPIITTPVTAPVFSRHTITSGVTLDRYGGFPTVAPGGGNFSLKLGNDNVGAQAEKARYYINVPPSIFSRYILVYRYAVVLQNPNHGEADQPRFEAKAYDSATNAVISCNQFSYIASSALPGFVESSTFPDVWYKPWSTGTIDLTGMAGKTVAIEFSAGDCALGGHFGYGYVDMNCGLFEVYAVRCNNSSDIILTAPDGYAHYKWMDATLSQVIDTNRVASLPAPSVPTTYAVILTPYAGYGCADTLYTTYVVANTTAYAGPDTTICFNGSVQLNGIASSNDTPMSYLWAPVKDLNCFNCKNPIAKPLKETTYYFTATSKAGCSFTDSLKVGVDTVIYAQLAKNKDTVCPKEVVTVYSKFKKNPPAATYNWLSDGGLVSPITRDSVRINWNTGGLKKIKLDINYTGGCFITDSLSVFVRVRHHINSLHNVVACHGDTIRLSATSTPPLPNSIYQWSPPDFLTCTGCQQTKSYTPVTRKYYVTITNENACADVAEVNVFIDSANASMYLPGKVCQYDSITIQNQHLDSALASYTWTIDTADIFYNDKKGTIKAAFNTPGKNRLILKVKSWGCPNSVDTTYIQVNKAPILNALIPSKGCFDQDVIIDPGMGHYRYYWAIDDHYIPDSTYKVQRPRWLTLGTKHIYLIVKDSLGCYSKALDTTIEIYQVPEKPHIILSEGEKVCKGDIVGMQTDYRPDYKYQWEPKEFFENANNAKTLLHLEQNTAVTVFVSNEWDCTLTDNVNLYTERCCEVFMPDAFSPNGDGRNDVFKPMGIDEQKLETFMIANRWGQIVYNSTTSGSGWDGTFNGQKQDAGTYTYYLRYICEYKALTQKGTIILIR